MNASLEKKVPSSPLIDAVNRNNSGKHIPGASDEGGHQRSIRFEADRVEKEGTVEKDDIDAGELLEERN